MLPPLNPYVSNLCLQKYYRLFQKQDQMKNAISSQRLHLTKFPFSNGKSTFLKNKKEEDTQEKQKISPRIVVRMWLDAHLDLRTPKCS